jgi:putative ABC transport system substrate-binding protein
MVPKADAIGALVNPTYPVATAQLQEVQEAAASVGVRPIIANASAERDFEPAFALLVQQRSSALMISSDPFFNSRRDQIVALAARHAVPAIYEWREFAEAGGLMSYGTSVTEAYRLAGIYAGRVLKGDKPAELPVMQSSKFEFVINSCPLACPPLQRVISTGPYRTRARAYVCTTPESYRNSADQASGAPCRPHLTQGG